MADWNATELEFVDISAEMLRTYTFPGGDKIEIDRPQYLHVSASGGHRIMDHHNDGHYVPAGFIHVSWRPNEGKPTFVA